MRKLREREMGERKIQTSSCARLEIRKKERMKRRKLWKGGQSKRKNTLKVKAVALTNRPYGSVAAEPQGATRFVCVCVCVCVWEGERWICIVFCQTSGCQQFASLAHYSQGRQLTWIMHSYTHIHTHTHTRAEQRHEYTDTCECVCVCAHAHTEAPTQKQTVWPDCRRTRESVCLHGTHTHTHTHTHTPLSFWLYGLFLCPGTLLCLTLPL